MKKIIVSFPEVGWGGGGEAGGESGELLGRGEATL